MATSATTTDWLYKKYMYYILRGKAWTPTPQVKIALYTTTPGSGIGDTGTEVIENDNTKYKRVTLPANDSTWSAATDGTMEISNLVEIVFPVPGTQSWGTITGCGILASEYTSGGTGSGDPGNSGDKVDVLMWVGRIATPKSVQSGDGAPRILVGQLKITRASCGN